MTVKVTIWVKANCIQCEMTKKVMDAENIIYDTRRLDRSPKATERFIEMGFMSAPIVETDDRRWSGFRINKIRSLANHLRTERAKGINVPLQPIVQVAEEVGDE